ncbi:MAG: hypothetical protein V4663_14725 [Bacteroidota bacterium]
MEQWRNDLENKVITESFSGSKERYDRAMQRTFEETLDWNSLLLSETIFPEHSINVHDIIKSNLGYLPKPYITLPYEPYLNALYNQHRSKILSDNEFNKEVSLSLLQIRNKIAEPHNELKYSEAIYLKHQQIPIEYRTQIRKRIQRILGYEANIETSVYCELKMCDLLSSDMIRLPEYLTSADYQSFLIIKYREILIKHGKEQASASPLLTAFINYL